MRFKLLLFSVALQSRTQPAARRAAAAAQTAARAQRARRARRPPSLRRRRRMKRRRKRRRRRKKQRSQDSKVKGRGKERVCVVWVSGFFVFFGLQSLQICCNVTVASLCLFSFSISASRPVRKKRRSAKGRVNNARATPSLSLRRRTASPRAANQSLRNPSLRPRSKRRRRYRWTHQALLHYTVEEPSEITTMCSARRILILQSSKYEANCPVISGTQVSTRPRRSLSILCRLLNPNLHQRPSRKRARKRKKKCLCWTWMTVSGFSSLGAACSKFNLNRDCSDLSRMTGEGSLISSTHTLKLFSVRWTDMKDLLALLFYGCSGSWIRLFPPLFCSPVEPAPSPQVTPVNTFLSNSLVTDLEGLSLSDTVLSPAVTILAFFWWVFPHFFRCRL